MFKFRLPNLIFALSILITGLADASTKQVAEPLDMLVKFSSVETARDFAFNYGFSSMLRARALGSTSWVRVQIPQSAFLSFVARPDVLFMEPNSHLRALDSAGGADMGKSPHDRAKGPMISKLFDNPPIPKVAAASAVGAGNPFLPQQWGMIDIGAEAGWAKGGGRGIVVAVIDSGVDYTHEDLRENIWRNPGESGVDEAGRDRSSNLIDDDANGYVDDVIGWDFRDNDNQPYDVIVPGAGPLLGWNAGHGTHCAGTIAAVGDNGIGISGVAPHAQIMPLRFMGAGNTGDLDAAIGAINYAVANGARVISNSWGDDGDPDDLTTHVALREAIQNAEAHGVLFIGVSGNGNKEGVGFDNDNSPEASIPGSFGYSNVISVAALDKDDQLAPFSNWGLNTVDLGAPGVRIFSTVPFSKYSKRRYKFAGMSETWDGTSMACPFVAGAAAVYWSAHPNASYLDVKKAILSSVVPIPSLAGKTVSGGKLNIKNLMAQ